MQVSINIDNSIEFIGSKNEDNYKEVFDSFDSAKKIRILTYNIPNKADSIKLSKLRELKADVDLRLILALPGLEYEKNGSTIDYNSYTEQSLEDKLTDVLKKLDVKKFPRTRKIDVCYKNHAKLIGTEELLYIGSANYSDATKFNYEAGAIIKDKNVIESIYDSFFDKITTVPFYGDSLDNLRICILELHASLENMSVLLTGYKEYSYSLTCVYDDAKELIKIICSIIERIEEALIQVQQYADLYEDTSDTVSDIKEYLSWVNDNEEFWDSLKAMTVDEALECLNHAYRDHLGLPDIPPAGSEYIDEETLFVPLYEMTFDMAENIEHFEQFWAETYGDDEYIDEVCKGFEDLSTAVENLISDILQEAEEEFKGQVKQIGHDSTIPK